MGCCYVVFVVVLKGMSLCEDFGMFVVLVCYYCVLWFDFVFYYMIKLNIYGLVVVWFVCVLLIVVMMGFGYVFI